MTSWMNSSTALKATVIATRAAARLSTRLSGRLAARLWFTPWRIPLNPRAAAKQAAWVESARRFELDIGEIRIRGFEGGSGPTVLLVHGWGDSARSIGAFLSPLANAGFRAVAVDLPGHGETSGGQTDALQIAAAVRAVADRTGPVHGVVAHSMGAHGTMLALRDGLSVEKVVLLAPAVLLDSAVGPFAEMLSLPPRAVAGLRGEIERRYGADVWANFAADGFVRNVHLPALILHDPDDGQVPFADARRLESVWRSARLEAVAGVGHTGILRNRQIVERVLAFLQGDPATRSLDRSLARSST